jgi:hypothetical protein
MSAAPAPRKVGHALKRDLKLGFRPLGQVDVAQIERLRQRVGRYHAAEEILFIPVP